MIVKIRTMDGPLEVVAYRTDTPGLVVARNTLPDGSPRWTVTHEKSGLMIGGHGFDTRKEARTAAGRLKAAADWTLCKSKLVRAAGLSGKVRDAIDPPKPRRVYSQDPAVIMLDVKNQITGERRVVRITEEEGNRAICDSVNTCTGPCECLIEPDATCPHGWPALEQAIVLHAK